MKPTFTLGRAIGATFARRALQPILIIAAIGLVLLLAIGGWLATRNAWWLVIEAIFIIAAAVFAAALVVLRIIMRVIEPAMTSAQKTAVNNFVDKFEQVTGGLQTPQFLVAFYVVRDILRPRPDSFIESVSRSSRQLGPDLVRLREMF